MNALIGLGGIIALLLVAGGLIGLLDRERFAPRWLLVAALLVAINDALLTRFYGTMPNLLPGADWNWQGSRSVRQLQDPRKGAWQDSPMMTFSQWPALASGVGA